MTTLGKLAARHEDLKRSLSGDPRFQEMQEIEQTIRVVARFDRPTNGTQALLAGMGLTANGDGRAADTPTTITIKRRKKAATVDPIVTTRKRRHHLSAAARKAIGLRMRKYWAAKRRKGTTRASGAVAAHP